MVWLVISAEFNHYSSIAILLFSGLSGFIVCVMFTLLFIVFIVNGLIVEFIRVFMTFCPIQLFKYIFSTQLLELVTIPPFIHFH